MDVRRPCDAQTRTAHQAVPAKSPLDVKKVGPVTDAGAASAVAVLGPPRRLVTRVAFLVVSGGVISFLGYTYACRPCTG